MTQTAIRLKTKVLPGKRLDVTAPELQEGEDVELIMLKADQANGYISATDFLYSLPPSNLTAEAWARIEKELQEEKDAWER